MTVLLAAGPRTRLQLLRVPAKDGGGGDRRYQVRLLEPDGPVVLATGRTYQAVYPVFETEAYWRGWTPREEAA
jgi:hypothetical protein